MTTTNEADAYEACQRCASGFILPSGYCDHCNTFHGDGKSSSTTASVSPLLSEIAESYAKRLVFNLFEDGEASLMPRRYQYLLGEFSSAITAAVAQQNEIIEQLKKAIDDLNSSVAAKGKPETTP